MSDPDEPVSAGRRRRARFFAETRKFRVERAPVGSWLGAQLTAAPLHGPRWLSPWLAESGAPLEELRRSREERVDAIEEAGRSREERVDALEEAGRARVKRDRSEPSPTATARRGVASAAPFEAIPEVEEVTALDLTGVVPRAPLPGLRTGAIPAALRRQAILLERIFTPSTAALRGLVVALPTEQLDVLDAVLLGRHEQPRGEPSLSPKRALEHLIHEGGLERLHPDEQANLLDPSVRDPSDPSAPKAALALLRSGALFELRPVGRRQACRLFDRLDGDGRVLLARVAARRIGLRSALADTDHEGHELAGSLLALAEAGGDPAPVLAPVAQPATLPAEEGPAGVQAAIAFALAERWPAEFARVAASLARGGAVLAGGAVLEGESLPEALAGLPAAVAERRRPPQFFGSGGESLDLDVLASALSAVFGVRYQNVSDERHAAERLDEAGAHRRAPVMAALHVGTEERLVFVESADGDAVRVRSPRGRSRRFLAHLRWDVPRHPIDPDSGLDQVDRDPFEARLGGLLIPRTS